MSNPTHEARIAMVNGHFPLPDETVAAMKNIREIFAETAERVYAETKKVRSDPGRVTAMIDMILAAKNVACDAVTLPHYPGPVVPVPDAPPVSPGPQ